MTKEDLHGYEWVSNNLFIIIGIFIFLNPFPHTTTIKETCFYLSVVIFLILFFLKKNSLSLKTPLTLPFGLFVFWSFLGLFFALNRSNTIHDLYSHLLKYIILYYIIINCFSSEKRLIALSWIVIISSTTFSIGGISYFYFILGHPLSKRFVGFPQASINILSVTTVFAIILCLNNLSNETNFNRKIILFICFISLACSILLSQTLSSVGALCLAVIIFFNKKKMLIGLLGIIVITATIAPFGNRLVSRSNNMLIALRVGINYHTFEIIKDYPIIGIGFGMQTFSKSLDQKKYYEKVPVKFREKIIYDDPHNLFFDVAVRLGLVGLAFFCYIIVVFFKIASACVKNGKDNFIKNWGRCVAAAFLAFLVIGFFHPVFSHMPEVILCTIFAMLTIVWRLNNGTISVETSR